jgi:hypothetical protein
VKLPSVKKPKLKRAPGPSKAARKSVRVPRPVEDLYRDMRDRRLLLPALALLVATAAVPFFLSAKGEPAPNPVPFSVPAGSEAVAPAVLAEQESGVRDYRERLDELKSKNPFASDAEPAETSSDGLEEGPVDPVGETVTPGATTPDPTTVGPAPVPSVEDPVTVAPPADPELVILAPRIDVLAGKVHSRKRIEDVEIGDLLPHRRKAPVAMLIGVSDDLKAAHFVVSGDVTETDGDGQCRPRANACEFLQLKDGEKRYFTFGPDEQRYSLKVTAIREVIVDRRKVADG